MTGTFSNFDLNLLRVFDAVMQERSVLRASQKLFLSQSAVSHSLKRLRETLDDELFVRTVTGKAAFDLSGNGLTTPPPFPESLLQKVRSLPDVSAV